MKNLLILILLLFASEALPQDTIRTTYPGTNQLWIKLFEQNKKLSETIYHTTGKEWMSANYTEDEKENWKWYYESGNPYFEATIIDDKIEGVYRIWYENDQLAEEIVFKNNLEDGRAIFYHSNGQVAMTGEYKEGQMINQWLFYDKNGNKANGIWQWRFAASREEIRMEGTVLEGLPTGIWKYRTTAGRSTKEFKEFSKVFK